MKIRDTSSDSDCIKPIINMQVITLITKIQQQFTGKKKKKKLVHKGQGHNHHHYQQPPITLHSHTHTHKQIHKCISAKKEKKKK